MNDVDLSAFMDTFRELAQSLALRAKPDEIADIGGSYFKILRRFPLDRVRAGADKCLEKCQRFPKPAEWISYIPAYVPGAEIRELTPRETTEWVRAERLRWDEEDPCHCDACREADVDHRFPRFVPDFDADGRDVRGRIGNRVITRGHCAHGFELKRWYAAKDAFWGKFHGWLEAHRMAKRELKKKKPFSERLDEIFEERRKAHRDGLEDEA